MIIFLFIIIFVHSLILTKLQFFPYPEMFVYPYLLNHGLKPYLQIIDQHFPGLLFLPINFNNLGLTDPQIARWWLIAVVSITHILLFLVSKTIFKSTKKALLVNLLYLIWQPFFEGWVLWIDNFLPLFFLSAFYFALKRKYFITGLILGSAVVFKQTSIPLSILIGALILYETRNIKTLIIYLVGLIFPVSLMLAYILNLGIFYDFWYWTIIFNLTIYAKFGTKVPPSVGFVTRVLLVYMTSILGIFFKEKRIVLILFIFLIGSLAGVFDRADFVHFQPSLPFAVLATVAGFEVLKGKNLFKLGLITYLLISLWWQFVFYKGHISNEGGFLSFGHRVLLFDSNVYAIAEKIKQNTHPYEKIFVFGSVPQLYQMTNTLPAGDIFVFQFPWFYKVAEDRILQGLIKDKPRIIIAETDAVIEGMQIKDFASKINEYINMNYVRIDNVGPTLILKRK